MWEDGKSDADKHNGSIHLCDTVPYSYILNEAIKQYKLEKGSFENYELFYQWVQDVSLDKEVKDTIYAKAKSELLKDYPQYNTPSCLFPFRNDSNLSRLSGIVNYLVADLLKFTKEQFNSKLHEYKCFIEYIKSFDEVDIFTLNHDLLLEKLLWCFKLEYSRGFSKENSEICYKDEGIPPLAVFNKDAFDKPIRIYKLHGSLNFYRFEHYIQGEKSGKYTYFTTTNYREKHFSARIDPKTREISQDHNFDIVPKFITGTDKTKIIKNDLMYSVLFERYEKSIAKAENLFISGYSFGDEHINNELKKRKDLNIVNQNPKCKYPYEAGSISNLKSLSDLK